MVTKDKSQKRIRGEWEESHAQWYELTAVYCDACGMLIPNTRFVVVRDGRPRRFCSPACAQLDIKVQQLRKRELPR